MTTADAETTTDVFLGGLVTLVQPRKGHRAGLDAALLQAAVPAEARGSAVDLGSGTGAVAFSIAARAPALRVVGVDCDATMLDLAAEALEHATNAAFAGRVRLVRAEVESLALRADDPDLAARCADWVLMNPPFDTEGSVRVSLEPGKRRAYVGDPMLLETWIATARQILRPGGFLALIHRAAALPRILAALQDGFGGISVLPVHPRGAEPAGRVLVRARSASRAPFRLLPPLVLHEADGRWTAEAERILRGAASIAF